MTDESQERQKGVYRTKWGLTQKRIGADGKPLDTLTPYQLRKASERRKAQIEKYGKPGPKPSSRTQHLMDLAVKAASEGWKNGEIAKIISRETGLRLSGRTITSWQRRYPTFSEKIEQARNDALDALEAAFIRRGLDDDDPKNFQHGMAMLRANRDEFKEKVQHEVTGHVKAEHLHIIATMPMEEVEASLARHLRMGLKLGPEARSLDVGSGDEGSRVQGELLDVDSGASDHDRRDETSPPTDAA